MTFPPNQKISMMEKIKGWNRNLVGGKRRHKGIQKYGKYETLSDRIIAEVKALEAYHTRVGQTAINKALKD